MLLVLSWNPSQGLCARVTPFDSMSSLADSRPEIRDVPANIASSGSSYGRIVKATALVGASSITNIVLAIVRTKIIAMLLGPSGVGLFGLFGSVADIVRTIAGTGINQSGVRQIAEAFGSNDGHRIAVTITTLRRTALVLGGAGAILLAVLCKPIARLTFGHEQYVSGVLLLAFAVAFSIVSDAQNALIQGMRRIGDLAKLTVIGGLAGTFFSIVIVYLWRESGVAASLVCVSAVSVITSWSFARRIKVERVVMTFLQVRREALALLTLGFMLMASASLTMIAAYLIRIVVLHAIDLDAAGLYQAAWTLGGLYIGFILQAMGADFYPRLTAVASDHAECNRLVNEQTEVSLLMAVPGLVVTLTFTPIVLHLFYSAKFWPAVELLRWICLGALLQVATSPITIIQLAKGAKNIFFLTRFASNTIHVGLAWGGLRLFGLVGAGIAFFAMSVIQFSLSYTVARRLSCFQWSAANRRLALFFAPVVISVFLASYLVSRAGLVIFGTALSLLAGVFSLKTLCALIPFHRLPRLAQTMIDLLGLAPPNRST